MRCVNCGKEIWIWKALNEDRCPNCGYNLEPSRNRVYGAIALFGILGAVGLLSILSLCDYYIDVPTYTVDGRCDVCGSFAMYKVTSEGTTEHELCFLHAIMWPLANTNPMTYTKILAPEILVIIVFLLLMPWLVGGIIAYSVYRWDQNRFVRAMDQNYGQKLKGENSVKLEKEVDDLLFEIYGELKIKEVYCDFCGEQILSSTVVPARKLQKAVENGFNPYKTLDIDTGNIGKDVAFAEFKRRVINDNTDWTLCFGCGLGFDMWLKKSFKRKDLDSAGSGLKCAFCGKILTGEAKVRHHHWWCGECEGEFKSKKVKRSS